MNDGRIIFLKDKFLKNLQRQWTIEGMAKEVNLSPPQLQKIFKSQTGMPPIAYLREKRLEKARELLEKDNWEQINQIGKQVGMPNDSHFTRDFKKKYEVTPTEYRKKYWEKLEAEKQNGQK